MYNERAIFKWLNFHVQTMFTSPLSTFCGITFYIFYIIYLQTDNIIE